MVSVVTARRRGARGRARACAGKARANDKPWTFAGLGASACKQRRACTQGARSTRHSAGKVSAYHSAPVAAATAQKQRVAAARRCAPCGARSRRRRLPARAGAPLATFNDARHQQEALPRVLRAKRRRAAPLRQAGFVGVKPQNGRMRAQMSAPAPAAARRALCAHSTAPAKTHLQRASARVSGSRYTLCVAAQRTRTRVCAARRDVRRHRNSGGARIIAAGRAAHTRARERCARTPARRCVRAHASLTPSSAACAPWPCRTRAPLARHSPRACARQDLARRPRGSAILRGSKRSFVNGAHLLHVRVK